MTDFYYIVAERYEIKSVYYIDKEETDLLPIFHEAVINHADIYYFEGPPNMLETFMRFCQDFNDKKLTISSRQFLAETFDAIKFFDHMSLSAYFASTVEQWVQRKFINQSTKEKMRKDYIFKQLFYL